MDTNKVRTFLAIPISKTSKSCISDHIKSLQHKYPQFRFVSPDNWHMTLHFFGAIEKDQLGNLTPSLTKLCSETPPFTILFNRLGGFPSDRNARILWVGSKEMPLQLNALKTQIDDILLQHHHKLEMRDFTPHLTMARLKRRPSGVDISAKDVTGMSLEVEEFVDTIYLYQSHLLQNSVHYEIINRFPLRSA